MACKLIGYRRVSTQKQGQAGLGMEAQDDAINAYSRATGCTLVASYTEVETGKGDGKNRPQLSKALAHAKRAGATLVIAKLDRLSRNVAFLANLMETDVDFVACDNPAANRLTIHILAAVAENEARVISQRTKAALAVAKSRGTVLGGKRDGQHALTNADRAKGSAQAGSTKKAQAIAAYADLLPSMREWRAEGLSLAAIADRLNQEGQTTRTGSAWSKMDVKRTLDRI